MYSRYSYLLLYLLVAFLIYQELQIVFFLLTVCGQQLTLRDLVQ